MSTGAAKLRGLLDQPGLIEAPGAHDVLTARMVEAAGFKAVYIGGLALCGSSLGLPDVGLVTMPELVEHARRVVDVVDIPVIVDLDDGGRTPLDVRRTVRLAEGAGVAAFHIEDIDASRGKHLHWKDGSLLIGRDQLRSKEDAVVSIAAAVDARRDPDTVVIARTDAAGISSVDDAIDRAGSYIDAGADMIFFSFLQNKDLRTVIDAVKAPVMKTSSTRSLAERTTSEADGLKVLLHPVMTYAAAARATWDVLTELQRTGELRPGVDAAAADGRVASWDAVQWAAWTDLAERYGLFG